MSAAEKKTFFRIATVLGTMRQRITAIVQSDIAQKLTRQYFLENYNENTSKQALQPGNKKCKFHAKQKQQRGGGESTSWWF